MNNYTELMNINSYEKRLEYLSLFDKTTGDFGRKFHVKNRKRWDAIREQVVARDLGYDMGLIGVDIKGKCIVHHINPVTEDMIERDDPMLYDPENLICVSIKTHNYIHYGGKYKPDEYIERKKGDNLPWKRV